MTLESPLSAVQSTLQSVWQRIWPPMHPNNLSPSIAGPASPPPLSPQVAAQPAPLAQPSKVPTMFDTFSLIESAVADAPRAAALVSAAKALKTDHGADADIAFGEKILELGDDFIPAGAVKDGVEDVIEAAKLVQARRAARAASKPMPVITIAA